MKDRSDLVRGWLRKAASDIAATEACRNTGALDAACFHAQQAVEKYLKAFLVNSGLPFPFSHNLVKLVELCAGVDPSFHVLSASAATLTPYAVEPRYDSEFWPGEEAVREAQSAALAFEEFVLTRLPGGIAKGIF